MTSLGLTGHVQCKWLVSGNANGWSSPCNYTFWAVIAGRLAILSQRQHTTDDVEGDPVTP